MKLHTLKNKYALAYPLLAVGLVLGSCSQEEGDNTLPENSQKKTITFTANPVTAETKGISTRVDLVPGNSNRNDGLKWVDDEKISFKFIGETYDVNKTFTVSVDEYGVASITGDTPDQADDYQILALSPAKTSNFPLVGSTVLTIPDELTQEPDNSHLRDYIYMYAAPDGTISVDGAKNATGGNFELDFNLLTSLLRFEITNNSSKEVTLKNVKISFPSGEAAKLSSRVTFNDDGSLTPTNFHTDGMTLKYPDISLDPSASDLSYMTIFPTEQSSTLNIDLTVETYDGFTKTIYYEIQDAPAFSAGSRYVAELDIDDESLEFKYTDGVGSFTSDGFIYTTYTFKTPAPDDAFLTWQVTPTRKSPTEYLFAAVPTEEHCPPPFKLPSLADAVYLLNQLETYPELVSLFALHRPDLYSFDSYDYKNMYPDAVVIASTYYTSGNIRLAEALIFTDPPRMEKDFKLGYSYSSSTFVPAQFLVRCVLRE